VAYDLDGNRLWGRIVERPTQGWGHSASPVVAGGRVVVHVRNLHGLDPRTGETVWTAPSGPRWGSPVRTDIDGTPVVITANGEIVRAADGNVLAKGLSKLTYCAPLVHDGIVYFIEHGGKAYRLPATADGETQPEELWSTKPAKDRYYASPVFHDGHIYCINQKGQYSVIDAATGEVVATEKIKDLAGRPYTSVVRAGSLLYLGSEGGKLVLMKPGREMEVVESARLDKFRSTPVFAGNRMYLRTDKHLYCLGH
jgi:hypothetical protein